MFLDRYLKSIHVRNQLRCGHLILRYRYFLRKFNPEKKYMVKIKLNAFTNEKGLSLVVNPKMTGSSYPWFIKNIGLKNK